MSQFTLYENLNPASRAAYPYFVDIQNALLEPLASRVVIPLARAGEGSAQPMDGLCPLVEVGGAPYVLLTFQLTNVPLTALKAPAGSLQQMRQEIISALDFLVSGI